MRIEIEVAGDVVEWQELLNGTRTATIEGASADAAWTLVGGVTWNIGLRENTGEGDLTLTASDGDELFGTLVAGDVAEMEGVVGDADHTMRLRYEIDGGSGRYESAAGAATAEGTLSRSGFAGRWEIELGVGSS
jgi:hypothetical protein